MELIEGGDVRGWLLPGMRDTTTGEKKPLLLKRKMEIARDTARGMHVLHTQKPAILYVCRCGCSTLLLYGDLCPHSHLDLKPANLVIDRYGTVKIAGRTLICIQRREDAVDYLLPLPPKIPKKNRFWIGARIHRE